MPLGTASQRSSRQPANLNGTSNGSNYIPEISDLGGFPPLSSIRLPNFLVRRQMRRASACADVPPPLLDPEEDGLSTSTSLTSFSSNELQNYPISHTQVANSPSFWPSMISTRVASSSLPRLQSLSVPSLPNISLPDIVPSSLPTISMTFGSPSFSFSRYLANYIFFNVDSEDTDRMSDYDSDIATTDWDRSVDGPTRSGYRSGTRSLSAGPPIDGSRTRRHALHRHRHRRGHGHGSHSRESIGTPSGDDTLTTADAMTMVNDAELLSEDRQRELRSRIYEIQKLDISDKERAVKMHELMTEKYYRLRRTSDGEYVQGEDADDAELYDEISGLSESDRTPTWYDKTNEIMGCPHYQRGVKLQCSTCDQWYTCRFCHDEVEDDHQLIRNETRNMLCMYCLLPQPAAQDCYACGQRVARYYCEKCKLWDDDPDKSIYHCNDCGICRIGEGLGKDFFHCKTCNVCMSISLENAHRCIEHSTECNCPICGEYMFTSTMTVVFMSCGHSIHQKCYYEHTKNAYKCPTCARTIINMEAQFRLIDREIEKQQLPEPYINWRSVVLCNDCSGKSNVPFHFLGLRCDTCKSYNTAQLRVIKPEEGIESDDADGVDNIRNGSDREYVDDEEVGSEVTDVLGDFENIESIFSIASLRDFNIDFTPSTSPHIGDR
ncbi:hypothetical protein V1512DRAFT_237140 [Lipomyces arxii]|uniref:uncharacterized protein n=1 Tax=Lipomyces arxii TaxID=56418 RepID=UPI0034CD0F49